MNTKQIAQETLAAIQNGYYEHPGGSRVDIASVVQRCVDGTVCYDVDELTAIRAQICQTQPAFQSMTCAVVNETTLQACFRLDAQQHAQRIGALNFASAKHPGGGFLTGAHTQEESLARSSALYSSLTQCPAFYAFHQNLRTSLYSDRMIYSPACPILRDDAGGWLNQPCLVDFITSPAPNAGAVQRNEPENRTHIVPTLVERASKLLALAAQHQCDTLVLGAWGCGVFQNDPTTVADVFWRHLQQGAAFHGRFRHIVFAVADRSASQATYTAFAHRFG